MDVRAHFTNPASAYPSSGAARPDAHSCYAEFLRPRVAQLLTAFRLDIIFHRAQGDYLYYQDEHGREVEVLDLIGGFGASLFGHNHPELIGVAQKALSDHLPFNAQGSVRGRAGLLAQALSERVGRSTGREYVVTLANTGAEAVEAAIKHAELEKFRQNERLLEKARAQVRMLRLRLREHSAYLPADFCTTAAALLGEPPFETLDAMLTRFDAAVRSALEAAPRFLAIVGGFHGKSTGSLQLTYRKEFREPWKGLGRSVAFIPREDEVALDSEVERARINVPVIRYEADGRVVLGQSTLVNIVACFSEPVQGEGGIHELSPGFLRALRRCADAAGFPLVMDEIQSGMGRCGTFLASELAGVRSDYYLLSKSLGGGLAKISALLVDKERYESEFGYLHTSTFADDDYSSAIALAALAMVDNNDGALIQQCREKGEALLQRLRSLQARFPEQIREVRGRGLMIGVELVPQLTSSSPLLRLLSEQGVLSYLVSGYLLHEHAIRVAPTLADHAVIRIEPSVGVSTESCDRFCRALEDLLTNLRAANTAQLLSFAIGNWTRHWVSPINGTDAAPLVRHRGRVDARVAFLVHFSTAADLQNWEKNLSCFEEADCARFLEQTRGLLHPFVLYETEVHSPTGKTVELVVVGVPFTAAQAIKSMREGSDWCLDMVKEGIELARKVGCTVVGLGGHTSIVSDGGRALVEDELVLTSGNSLTVAAAHEALFRVAKRIGLDARTCRLGVVGAAGNVGATLAELAADEVSKILLIARKDADRFLRPVAQRIYRAAFERVVDGHFHRGIAEQIADTKAVRKALSDGHGYLERFLSRIYDFLAEELGDDAPIRFSDSMQDLQSCQLVITATNAARPVVSPAHIADRAVVVCDVAVPQDVEHTVESQRPLARVIRGGIVKAPLGQVLGIPAVPLRGSELYGCLAETILLGFSGCSNHFSYGPLSIARVRQIREWAAIHGFEIAEK
jgi:acetylornithine/succinyldiaminopimelate/putrescine aminotransferase/predicted amino acid dehydrogenase